MNVFSFHRRRAFTLIELLVVIAIIALLVGILLPALGEARRASRKGVCQANLHEFGIAYANYAADFKDSLAAMTWYAGRAWSVRDISVNSNDTYTFPARTFDVDAAADQAVAILRFRADRTDIAAIAPGWIPFVLYSHLTMNDYLQQRLPEKMVICPEDRIRSAWQDAVSQNPTDPNGPFFALSERPPGNSNAEKRWPYSSSYQMQPSFYSPDKASAGVPTVSQGPAHNTYNAGNGSTRLGKRRQSDVSFPSNKVHMYDANGRHVGRRSLFYAYGEVTQPMLFGDSSVVERSSRNVNNGWDPNTPNSRNPTRIAYTPNLNFESPTRSGAASEYVNGNQQWTQAGLRGADWGMNEEF